MNPSTVIPSDEIVSATTSLPELSDLSSSASTFHSTSSISSIGTTSSDEDTSVNPESHPNDSNRSIVTSNSRTFSDTSSATSTSQPPIHTRRSRPSRSTNRRRYSTSVVVLNNLLQFSFLTIMNAAITIFGVGIGVGIILADSFRSPAATTANNNATASRVEPRGNEHATATVPVSAATPTCRATFRRAIDRIQEAPPINIAAISALPAQ